MWRIPLEVPPDLSPFSREGRNHLLRVRKRLLAVERVLELFQPFQSASDRPKIGERSPNHRSVTYGIPGAVALLDQRVGRLALGANEQDQAIRRGDPVKELDRAQQTANSLFQVDNVNQVALAVNVRLHLGIPPADPVTVVNPGFNEIFDDERHETPQHLTRNIRPRPPGRSARGDLKE